MRTGNRFSSGAYPSPGNRGHKASWTGFQPIAGRVEPSPDLIERVLCFPRRDESHALITPNCHFKQHREQKCFHRNQAGSFQTEHAASGSSLRDHSAPVGDALQNAPERRAGIQSKKRTGVISRNVLYFPVHACFTALVSSKMMYNKDVYLYTTGEKKLVRRVTWDRLDKSDADVSSGYFRMYKHSQAS
ncbi:hypothetical protein AMELA_G00009950 [Ameiurus melas]|uniref:Uncharacterized protein n=1 Tax=Ameiurus melas TaxID=219545 RepID=A0A7J6BKK5_AMEME|nr:hypothetical protein AMELA_G00009950 [Ameiurus melas]